MKTAFALLAVACLAAFASANPVERTSCSITESESPESRQECNWISKQNHREPNQKSPLHRVRNTVRDRTNIVHENVGRDGLKVKEDSVGEDDEKHGGVHSEDG